MASLLRLSATLLAAALLRTRRGLGRAGQAAAGQDGPLPAERPAQGRRLRRGRVRPRLQRLGGAGPRVRRHQPTGPAQAGRHRRLHLPDPAHPRPDESTEFARLILVANAAGTRRSASARSIRWRACSSCSAAMAASPSRRSRRLDGQRVSLRRARDGRIENPRLRARLKRSQDRALDWLLAARNRRLVGRNVDLTGSVIEALNAAGRRDTPAQPRPGVPALAPERRRRLR